MNSIKLLILSPFLLIACFTNVQAQFVTTWRTTSSPETITIPSSSASANYDINWVQVGNPGNFGSTTGVTGTHSITLPTAGTYRITLSSNFKRINFNNGGDKDKILTVEQWGTAEWTSMSRAFYGCSNLTITATDEPDLSNVRTLYSMFKNCSVLNQNISSWDVSNITNMREMFSGARLFNQPIGAWDVGKVTSMREMFRDAGAFNKPIGAWDVKAVTDMTYLFLNCNSFNQSLSSWNVVSVKNMLGMFINATAFNQPLNWGNKSREVTNMREMFRGATAFNQPIGSWDVGKVENMYRMFFKANKFNQNISSWNVSSVTNMSEMFYDCHSFNQPLNQWGTKTSKVTTMRQMFRNSLKFNQPIGGWDVSSVTDMTMMFYGTLDFNQSLNDWGNKTNKVTTMLGMFYNARSFNGSMNLCDVSSVTNMSFMFSRARSFNQNINDWNVSNVKDMSSMFLFASAFDKPLDKWNVSKVENMFYMFGFARAFNQPIDSWNVISVKNMGSLFRSAIAFDKDIGSWNVSNVMNMSLLFFEARKFNRDISNWNVSKVTNMNNMFWKATSFNKPLNQWGTKTGEVRTMIEMFRGATVFNQNINDWDVSKVTNMSQIFYEARDYNQPMDKWNVHNVTNMDRMFYRATNFDQNLGGWDVSNVTKMTNMLLRTALSTTNYDNLLIGWDKLTLRNNIRINVNPATYCLGSKARQSIINKFGWTFSDAGPLCSGAFITTWDTNLSTPNNQITIPTDASSSNYNIGWEEIGTTNNGVIVGVNGTHTIMVTPGKYRVKILGDFQRINFNNSGDKDKLLTVEQWGVKIFWNSMANAFYGCSNLTTVPATESPILTSVTDLSHMFHSATKFNISIDHWDVSNVTDMQSLFHGATIYNQPLNSWNVSKVTDMRYMFTECTAFDQPLSNWNVSEVKEMRAMFWAARAFNRPLSNWDVSKVTSTREMFADASVFDQDISAWDVSSITQADNMLDNTAMSITNYDRLLIEWDKHALQNGVTLGATGLKYCLGKNSRENMITADNWTINDAGAECKDAFITTWDTRNGTINTQFIIPTDGTSANYNIKWEEISNTSNYGARLGASGTQYIFPGIGRYRVHITGDFQNIYFNNQGDKDKILTVEQWGAAIKWNSMARAFKGCTNLTVPATDAPDLSGVTSMQEMFMSATSLNNDISHWVVSNVTNMRLMFFEASSFNKPLSNWDVSNVTNMAGMFTRASAFNSALAWGNKTRQVTDMNHMFANATVFNQDISGWDVSSVTDMTGMMHKATAFNQPIGNWANKTRNVTDMKWMFEDATSFDQNIGTWDVSNVTNMTRMLNNSGLSRENYDYTLIAWDKQSLKRNVKLDANGLEYCLGESARNNMIASDRWDIRGDSRACSRSFITTWDTRNSGSSSDRIVIPSSSASTNYDIEWEQIGNPANYGTIIGASNSRTITGLAPGRYTVKIRKDFKQIFFNNSGDKAKILTVSQWGDIKWNTMNRAFKGCTNLTVPATDAPDLSGVTNMREMFSNCRNFNNPINHWDVSNVTNMYQLFHNSVKFDQPLNSWDVSKVTSMTGMFSSASAFNGSLNWGNKTSSVTKMDSMFINASAFNQDISDWDVGNVTDMRFMFSGANSFNQNINSWDVSNVTNMYFMFSNAQAFDQPLDRWDVSKVFFANGMLDNTSLSIENYDNILIEWNKLTLVKQVSLGANGLQYCKGKVARANLTRNTAHHWTIFGDSEACPDISVHDGPNDASPIILDAQPEVISYGSLSGSQTTTANITKTFTIKNVGVGALSVYSITVSGTTYKVDNPPNGTASIAPSNNITFTITLPAGSGVSTETVTIRSYDQDEDPFTFRVSNDAALPITLRSFTGYAKEGRHILEWVTSSEVDNDYFLLERSADGLNYEVLKTIDGSGTTTVEQRYQSIDSDPFVGKNYYRLQQVDMDGTSTQAGDVVLLTNKSQLGNFGLVVYPNPTNSSSIKIRLSSSDTKRDLRVGIIDIQGREFFHKVYDTTMLNKEININPYTHLVNGLYIIELEQGDQVTRKKIIVKN